MKGEIIESAMGIAQYPVSGVEMKDWLEYQQLKQILVTAHHVKKDMH